MREPGLYWVRNRLGQWTIAAYEPHDAETLAAAIRDTWENVKQVTIRHYMEHIGTVMRRSLLH